MLSNLPIIAGDKIKLVILHSPYGKGNVLNQSGYCYPDGVLSPAFLPISGEYNDYGGIENVVEDWNYNLIETMLKEKFPGEIRVNRKCKSDWTLKDVIFGIERTNPQDEDDKDLDLSYVMIRQDVWDFAVELQKSEMVSNYGEEAGEYKGDIEHYKYLERKFEKANVTPKTLHDIRDNIFKFGGSGRLIDSGFYDRYMTNAPEEDKKDIFKQWSEIMYIISFMNSTRKAWMIQQGAGSQDASWEQYLAFSKKVIDICEAQLKECD
jgi:hypothetical protein